MYNTETLKKIIVFLTGFAGLTIVATLISNLNLGAWLNTIMYPTASLYHFLAVYEFVAYFIVLSIVFMIIGRNVYEKWLEGFKNKQAIKDGIVIGIIIMIFTILYNTILTQLRPTMSSNLNETSIEKMTKNSPFLSFIVIVIFAPFVEEFTYRYGLFGALKKSNRFLAYAGTILVFSLIHFNYSNDSNVLLNELLNLPAYMVAAGLLSYGYDKHGLACSMTAHALNNLVSVITTLIMFRLI